jgi:hypothetical protein
LIDPFTVPEEVPTLVAAPVVAVGGAGAEVVKV